MTTTARCIMEGVANDSKTSLLHGNRTSRHGDYSTFDAGGSIDSGLSFSADQRGRKITPIESASTSDAKREKLSITWSKIDAFADLPGPSCWKRLCSSSTNVPTSKQILFNGEWWLLLLSIFLARDRTWYDSLQRVKAFGVEA